MFVPIGTKEKVPRKRFPVVTVILVALNSLVFLVEAYILLTEGERALSSFITPFDVVPAAVASGRRLYTLFTSMFVHGSLTHIAFNMVYLLGFGDNVEDRLGRRRYVTFYLLAGLFAAFAQIATDPASQVPTVGASGAVAGILSGYIMFFPRGVVRMFLFLGPWTRIRRVPALMYVAFWFITQFFNGVLPWAWSRRRRGAWLLGAHRGLWVRPRAGLGLQTVPGKRERGLGP